MSRTVVLDADTTAPDCLAVSSHEQLVALRNTFDERLGALERALDDPSQASSLVPLVLDLARVATDEAAAVARQACLETQLEAHRAARAAGVADRQTITELRRLVGELKTQLEALSVELSGERQQIAEARSAVEHGRDLLASLKSRAAAAEERAVEAAGTVHSLTEERNGLASSQAELQAEVAAAKRDAGAAVAKERAAGAALRQSLDEATAQRELSNAELVNARQALAAAQRALEEDRALIATVEGNAAAASKRAADEAGSRLAVLEARAAAADLRADEAADTARALATERQTLAEERSKLEAELAAARKDLVAAHEERAAATELRGKLEKQLAEAEDAQAEARRASAELRAAESARAASGALQARASKTPAVGKKASRREPVEAPPAVVAPPAEMEPSISAPPAAAPAAAAASTAVSEAAPTRARAKAHKAAPEQAGQTVAEALRRWTEEDASEPPPVPAAPAAETLPPTYWDNAVRQDPRHSLSDRNVHIQVDGESAQLVDLSANGAQVVTSKALKPGHQVRVCLPSGSGQTIAKAKIAWARLEPGGGCLQDPAGLAFTTVDPKAIAFLLDGAASAPGGDARSRPREPG